MRRLIEKVISAPRRALAVMLAFVAAVSTGAMHLHFDFSPQQVYGGQHEAVAFCEQHKQLFRFEDSIAVVLLEARDDETLLRPDRLNWMHQLARESAGIAGVVDVSSLVTLEVPRISLRRRQLLWTPLVPQRRFDDAQWLERRLNRMPLINDLMISGDRKLALTLVSLDPTGRDIDTVRKTVHALQNLLTRMDTPRGTRVEMSGVPVIRVDVIRNLIADQAIMTPISAALFIVVALVMYRSWKVTAISLLSVIAAVGLTVGIMGWCGMTFSILSNIVPTLVLIIGAANCVHIIGRLQILMTTEQDSTEVCVRRVMTEMSRTCLLTLATTAIGFGSLLLARSDLLQLLAVQSAMGMVCNYLCLMLILAPGLALTAHHLRVNRPATDSAADAPPSRRWERFGTFVCSHAIGIVVVHLLLAGVALAGSLNMKINSFMFETYEPSHPVVQVTRTLENQMSGLISLEVQLQADHPDRWYSVDMLTACRRIREQMRQDDRITFTRDYVELLSALDDRVLSDDAVVAGAGIERVLRLLPRIDRSEIMTAFVSAEPHRARMMLRVRDIGSSNFKDLFVQVNDLLKQELPDDVGFQLTGDAWLHTVCMDQFVRDLFSSLLAASGIIFVLIGLLFRSAGIGLVSAVPNLFPLTMTLGYMYLREYQLTAGNVIVFAISLGIAVDDTVHFLARYREEVKPRRDTPTTITEALRSSGRAIVLTSLLVVSGLSVLVFSEFLPTRRFAELTAITMLAALPGDLLLLPALLSLWGRDRST